MGQPITHLALWKTYRDFTSGNRAMLWLSQALVVRISVAFDRDEESNPFRTGK